MAEQLGKMGFARKIVEEGAQPSEIINADGKWDRKVSDLRSYLQLLDMGVNPRERVATFISYDEGGLFITLVTLVNGREGDHVSDWIYIPREFDVPVGKIEDAHQLVKKSLQNKVSDEELKQFFNGDYQLHKVPEVYKASEKGSQKWGYYDLNESGDSLTDFFERAYQEVFTHYEAIYLHEKDTKIGIRDDKRFVNLTQTKLYKSVLICPPAKAESQRWTKVNAKIFLNEKPFIKKARMKEGSLLRMELRRNGFETISAEKQKLTLEHDGKPFVFPMKDLKWMKRICSSDFDIRNENGEQLNNRAEIKINDQKITRDGAIFPEDVWNECKATIKCPNYQTIENQEFKLSEGENKATMHRLPIDYTVKMVNGKKAKMTLESKDLPEDGSSPLKGYKFGSDNHLRFKSDKWKQRLIGFVFCLVVVACWVLYVWFTHHEFSEKPSFPFVEVTEVEQDKTETCSVSFDEEKNERFEAAIAYLDKNETWHRDSLESFDETKELFDALNTYDYDKLIELNARLGSSTSYNTLIATVDSCKTFMNTKVGSEYNNKNDSLINWKGYAVKLKNGQKKLDKAPTSTTADISTSKRKSPKNPNTSTTSPSDFKKADNKKDKEQMPSTKEPENNSGQNIRQNSNSIRI